MLRLLSLIKPSKSGLQKLSGNAPWTINSEALWHFTVDLEYLVNGAAINLIHVDFPNGKSGVANTQWNICLGFSINLEKVLYIPGFSCNLIFMAKLIRELNCIVIFDKDVLVIHDHTSKSLVQVDELRGGVYCIKEFAKSKIQVFVVVARNLWHNRLGHPSNQVLSLLSKELGIKGSCMNKTLNLVMYAFVQNRHVIGFVLVVVRQMNCLETSIVIFGDLTKPLLNVVLITFSPLLMVQARVFGFIC